ncbi:MAG: penicillin-binding protein 2 [Candidatus Omnitrophota bacterium]|jgi:penicillin-binding protein 2
MRVKIAHFTLAFLFILLGLGLFNLGVLQSRRFCNLSDKNCIRLLPQPGARGIIFDRNNKVIVDNYLTYDVMLLSQDNKDLEKTFSTVARILETSPEELKSAFKNGYSAAFMPVAIAKNIDIKKAIILEEVKMDLPGIIIQARPVRYYPYGKLASHAIGYLNEIDHWRLTKLANYGYKTKDIVGYTGVEEKYDYYLRQEEGALSLEVDHRGRVTRVLGFKPPQSGKDIRLTLDLKIQKIVEDALGDRIGSVIIMEPATGEIIALASSPGFNPAVFVKKSISAINNLFNHPDSLLLNRAIQGVYPPASVFKLVVATAALETNKIRPGTTFTCSGSLRIGRRQFRCWDTHGTQDLIGGIAHSCDVFFYHTGLLLGPQLIHDYALKFGFHKPTGVDLPYESVGFVPDPLWKKLYRLQGWFDGDTANLTIGQGDLLVTPLQVVRMTAAFANGGFLVNPYIVKAIDGRDISLQQRRFARLNLKDKTLDYIRQGLRKTVTDGTANVLSGLRVSLAGKTGTSQVPLGQPHAWFTGFFPFKNPQFIICVFLEHGGSGYYACVLTKQIIEAMAKEGLI